MANIKIKDVEGDAEAIHNLFKDSGFDWNKYLITENEKPKVHIGWLGLSIALFFIMACSIWNELLSGGWAKVTILGTLVMLAVVVSIIQLNYNNWQISAIAGVAGIFIISIALNIYTPQEAVKKIEAGTDNLIKDRFKPTQESQGSTN